MFYYKYMDYSLLKCKSGNIIAVSFSSSFPFYSKTNRIVAKDGIYPFTFKLPNFSLNAFIMLNKNFDCGNQVSVF